MLTSLSIGNFKAFGETQTIPIRPITLIFGANSSGKSSIIHSLLLANHALETGDWDVREPRLGGGSVDLGGLARYRHGGGSAGSCHFGYGISGKSDGEDRTFEVVLTAGVSPADGTGDAKDPPAVTQKVELAIEGQPALTFVPNGRDTFKCDAICFENAVVRALAFRAMQEIELKEADARAWAAAWATAKAASAAAIKSVQDEVRSGSTVAEGTTKERYGAALKRESEKEWFEAALKRETENAQAKSPEMVRKATQWLLRYFAEPSRWDCKELLTDLERESREARLTLFSSRMDEIRGHELWDGPECELLKPGGYELWENSFVDLMGELSSITDPTRSEEVKLVMYNLRQLIKTAFRSLNEALFSLCYLGPLRATPKRHRVQWDDGGPDQRRGLDAWARITSDFQAQEIVNRWMGAHYLGTPYRLKTRRLVYDDDPSKGVGPPDLVFEDSSCGLQLSHRDLGFGITQVLPILVSAASPNKGIIAIEQPELHLHPAMQAELGDVFIESALGERKNTFLLETHSEHLILRIMRRIRETHLGKLPKEKNLPPVRPSDAAVLYVEKEGPRSIVREFPLNERGELVKAWPGGFFEEDLREVLG